MSENKKSKSGIWALFVKLGGKIMSLLAKLGKLIKFTKVGLGLLSFAGYAAIYNWKLAVLLMVSFAFHESGHVWAMKKKGIKTKGFYFIPFVGGAAIAEEKCKTYGDNFYISIMGPAWGCALAYVCAIAYWITGLPMLAAAAGFMCVLNLFNLLPIVPLDGGQMIRSIAFSIHKKAGLYTLVCSFLLSLFVFNLIRSGIFALITIVGGIELFFEYRKYQKNLTSQEENEKKAILVALNTRTKIVNATKENIYPDMMSTKQVIINAILYLGLIATLFALLLSIKHLPGADVAANFLS